VNKSCANCENYKFNNHVKELETLRDSVRIYFDNYCGTQTCKSCPLSNTHQDGKYSECELLLIMQQLHSKIIKCMREVEV